MAIRSARKREFTDPSIATAALGASPQKLLADLPTFGFVFETLCIRDLRVYTSAIGGMATLVAIASGGSHFSATAFVCRLSFVFCPLREGT